MHFIFEQIRTGGDRNFAYLLGNGYSKEAVVIDPSYQPEHVVDRAKAQGLNVALIINTHGHEDHTNGNRVVQELTGAKIAAYKGSSIKNDRGLEDGQVLNIAHNLSLRILYTPGHCEDHIVIFVEEHDIAITGDHLFVGKIGGTSTKEHAKEQYDHLHRLYQELPLHTTIWPGHDVGCRPSSTLALEKISNPFICAENFQAFLDIKADWSSIKRSKGLV